MHCIVKAAQICKLYWDQQQQALLLLIIITYFILFIIKNDWHRKAGREGLTPYQSVDPSPTISSHKKEEEKSKGSRRQKGSEELGQ